MELAQREEEKHGDSDPRGKRDVERERVGPLADPDVREQDKRYLNPVEDRLGRTKRRRRRFVSSNHGFGGSMASRTRLDVSSRIPMASARIRPATSGSRRIHAGSPKHGRKSSASRIASSSFSYSSTSASRSGIRLDVSSRIIRK